MSHYKLQVNREVIQSLELTVEAATELEAIQLAEHLSSEANLSDWFGVVKYVDFDIKEIDGEPL